MPYAFTEHGTLMAANILNSERASAMSVYVIRAFVKLRQMIVGNHELSQKLGEMERRLDNHEGDYSRFSNRGEVSSLPDDL